MKKYEIGVIGLGKFGLQFGTTLMELGHTVVGVDTDPDKVRHAQDSITQAYAANAADKDALVQLRFQDLDIVAVSVGAAMETSILATLNLQEMGVRTIVAKAYSPAHKKVLERIGAHHVVQPEADVATLTAHRLSNPGLLGFLPVGGGFLIREVPVEAWAGKTLADLKVRDNHGVLVAAVRSVASGEYTFVPDPRLPFARGDFVLLIGKREDVAELRA